MPKQNKLCPFNYFLVWFWLVLIWKGKIRRYTNLFKGLCHKMLRLFVSGFLYLKSGSSDKIHNKITRTELTPTEFINPAVNKHWTFSFVQ